jgi:hypothetical protein
MIVLYLCYFFGSLNFLSQALDSLNFFAFLLAGKIFRQALKKLPAGIDKRAERERHG